MSRYQLFGRCLESDLLFPELTPGTGSPDWVLRTSSGNAEPPAGSVYLGEDDVQGDIRVRLYGTSAGFWLAFDDSGSFAITDGGRMIRWYRPTGGGDGRDVDAAARIDVLGRVLSLALHADGRRCLHGSGVCLGGVGLGFLAPKFHGKSTLSLALVRAGARLVTDDTLVVDPASIPLALPGVHVMRLWSDSARRLLLAHESGDAAAELPDPAAYPILDPSMYPIMDAKGGLDIAHDLAGQDKLCLPHLAPSRRMREPAPLAAIYLLAPAGSSTSERQPAAARTLLPPTAAALALVGNGKLTPLLGRREAAIALRRAVDVARAVPVYTLSFLRDFNRLPEVVEQILDWHASSCPALTTVTTGHVASPSLVGPHLVGR